MQTILHKKGTSFTKVISVSEDLADCTAVSQVRRYDGTLLSTLTTEIAEPVEETTVVTISKADTSSWAVGKYLCDVRFTHPDETVSATETFELEVEKSITQ